MIDGLQKEKKVYVRVEAIDIGDITVGYHPYKLLDVRRQLGCLRKGCTFINLHSDGLLKESVTTYLRANAQLNSSKRVVHEVD